MSSPLQDLQRSVAAESFAALTERRQIRPFTDAHPDLDFAFGYAAAAEFRRLREARGEKQAGRKIGFTNRKLWVEFGVDCPAWGDMYEQTIHDIAALGGRFSLAGLFEPRIEPEIAFKLSAAPEPGMDESALLRCIAWVAHGFEIVDSSFPAWRFKAPDIIAVGVFHRALLLGKPRLVAAGDLAAWLHALASFTLTLRRDGAEIETGRATNVLDGPLKALRHLVEVLQHDRSNPPLRAGEIVTTGTVTGAYPIRPGETWSTSLSGIGLDGIAVKFG